MLILPPLLARVARVSRAITFLATFPVDRRSDYAIQISGQDGMHIELDIPESQVPNAIGLAAMRGQVLKVTVVPMTEAEVRRYELQSRQE